MSAAGVNDDAGRIAIIGMAGRFPGAADVAALWRSIMDGGSRLSRIDADDLRAAGQDPALLDQPGYVPVAGVIDDVEYFDAGLFGYSAREAELLDPQHRHFLEVCWTALESAGYDPTRIGPPVGVFAGARVNTYLLENLLPQRAQFDHSGLVGLLIGNDKDFLATNVSYRLGLTGPSLTVQTACSTSLVATHLACQSLLAGECDLALAGGSAIAAPHRAGYRYVEGGIYSPDGRCRPFADDANGTVGGSGVAAVVLRRLEDAVAAGDPIHAVILGSAVNNDGRAKVGFTAPSIDGQTRAIAEALAVAGVPADTVGYVEAHGTGTSLGDPIEVAALTAAFRADTDRRGYCALGSIKAGVGHLDAAAGVTGLIKAALVVRHGVVPPLPYVETPNPAARLPESPFFVPREPGPWPLPGRRRAGVSSFGIGGTNAHVVLEEPPPTTVPPASDEPEVVVVSARTAETLTAARDRLAAGLREPTGPSLADAAVTLQCGRSPMRHRFAVAARTPEQAADVLAAGPAPAPALDAPRVVFLLPGQGAQRPGVGAELYAGEPTYRAAVDRCAAILEGPLGLDIRTLLHAEADDPTAANRLRSTELAQPALFTVEYAAAALWQGWGVRPDALVGHSLGEYVAAALAGALPLEDALTLVARRGQLMRAMPAGAMLAVLGPVETVDGLLDGDVALAAVNAPTVCVVSGPAGRIASVAATLAARGVATRPLATSHAFHSAMMDPVRAPLRSAVAQARFTTPTIPLTSGLTGDWLRPDQVADPGYWADQLRRPVRFADALRTATAEGSGVLVELGPGRALSQLARAQAGDGWRAIAGLGERGERLAGLSALGEAWCAGVAVDWAAVRAGRPGRRVPLPTYPFERRRYWIDPPTAILAPPAPVVAAGPPPAGSLDAVAAAVAEIWRELLGVATVTDTDGFYDLGGHSLLAAQVLARLRARLGVELSIDRVLAAATLGELTAAVRAALSTAPPVEAAEGEIRPAPRVPGGLPLSPPQQRLWVLEQLDPGTAVYHLPIVLRLRGRLDVAALARSLSTVVQRHEALRSRFSSRDGVPVQHAARAQPVALTAEETTELDAVLAAEVRHPFDLRSGPPVRFRLLRPGPDEHVLVVTVHHLVVDGWSVGVLVDELMRCYRAELAQVPPGLAPVTLHCADVAAHEPDPDPAGLAFWAGALAEHDEPLRLPTDRPRPVMPSGRGGRVLTRLDPAAFRAFTDAAGDRGATLYMGLLAALGALLTRLGGQSRVVIGTPVANRPGPELERVVGLLANTLPVPLDTAGDPTFGQLLQRARDSAVTALAHQSVPYERIVADLAPDRDLGHNPLFAVMLAVQNAPLPPLRLPGLTIEPVDVHTGTAKFDLTFDATPVDEGLRLSLEYSADLWDEATARSLLRRLTDVMMAAASDPDTPLHALPVLAPDERERVRAWGDGGPAYPPTTVVELVARQIRATPDATAVADCESTLTYAELDAAADTIAARLAGAGVARGDRVALHLPRSGRGVAAILAVLRLGAAYVPLDVSYPRPRLEMMLHRCGARFLLVAGAAAVPLPAGRVIDLDAIDHAPGSAVHDGPQPDDLAYVIFTSGSTGEPKGIGLPQRALANLVQWQVARSALPPGARTAQLTPYSFDVHFQEIFGTLAGGGTLVVLADELRRDPSALLRQLAEHRVRRLFLPYVLLASLVDAARRDGTVPAELAEVVTAGEQLQVTDAVREFFRRLPGAVLDNHYGPAETHAATAELLSGDPDGWPTLPAIGQPLPGAEAYVADPSGAAAGVGSPGELWLAGAQLSPGYVGDDEATRRQFRPHPADPARRAYRTGDVVRWSADGRLHYLGRADAQVKIRGQRVEPAEVEAVLGSHRGVRECAVVPQPGPDGRARLVGYLAPSDVDASDVRAFLAQRVPAHLVPSLLVATDVLPRTPSGKIDRRRLPAPSAPGLPSGTEGSDAVDPRVAEAWRATLGLPGSGGPENFFEAGGDSILAIALSARVSEGGLAMAPRDVFEHQTLAGLSAALRQRASGPTGGADPAGTDAAGDGDAPPAATPAMLALRSARGRAVTLTAPRFDAERVDALLLELVAAQPALRARLVPSQSPRWTVAVDQEPLVLHEVDLSRLPADEAARAAGEIDASLVAGLDPVHGPVFAAALDQGPASSRLTLAAHPSLVGDQLWPTLLAPAWGGAVVGTREPVRLRGRADRLCEIGRRHRASLAQVVTALLIRAFVHSGQSVVAVYRDERPPDVGPAGPVVRLEPGHRTGSPFPTAGVLRAVKRATSGMDSEASTVEIYETGADAPPPGRNQLYWWRDGVDIAVVLGDGVAADNLEQDLLGAAAELANARQTETLTTADFPLAPIDDDALAALVAAHGVPADLYPVTPMQRTMLARDPRDAPAGLFAVRTVDALPAAVDPVALRAAFAAVLARHPILRTSFHRPAGGSTPLQLVHASVQLPWTELDWRDTPAPQLRERLERFLAEDFAAPFDVGRAPLLRFTLIRLPGGGYQLVFTGHHLLTDGWSRSLLLQDVPALYAAALAQRPWPARVANAGRQLGFAARLLSRRGPDRPHATDLLAAARPHQTVAPEPPPFRDHVASLATQRGDVHWTAYLSQLDGVAGAIPPDGDGAPASGSGYRRRAGTLPTDATDALTAAARAHRVTLAAMTQAAWALVLARHTGAAEVMFGVTSSGRRADVAGYERMVGLFITTLPQRARLDPASSGLDLMRAIQADAARRPEHIALVDLERRHAPAGGRLFETIIVVDNFPQDAAQHRLGAVLRTGHPFADDHFDLGMTEFDLRLEVIPARPLGYALCHHRERHSDELADSLLTEFAALLLELGREPGRPVGDLLRLAVKADAA